jgi:hypothetical protein
MMHYSKRLSLLFVSLLAYACSPYEEVSIAGADKSFGYVPAEFVTESGLEEYKLLLPQGIINPGKALIEGRYLFIGENKKGIHVFDNINPQSPVAVAFISVPGSVDFLLRNQTLITTNGNDLLALNINAINLIAINGASVASLATDRAMFSEVKRLERIFTYPNFPEQRGSYFMCLDSEIYVTEWRLDSVNSKKDCFR